MDVPRTEADLLQLIANQVEESVSLDYKRGEALTKTKADLSKEITKDVSSFANSAGGLLIYGIAEGSDGAKHRPVSLAPIDRMEFSKERLEHFIYNIQPRVTGIEIVPVPLSSHANHVAYVVVIPASTTAHQCTDKRYYRRFNFEAVAMEDYEVRDVMNRRSLPKIELHAELVFAAYKSSDLFGGALLRQERNQYRPRVTIKFTATNIGGITARNVVGFVDFSRGLLLDHKDGGKLEIRNFHAQKTGEYVMGHAKRGNPQWVPILPTLSLVLESFELPITTMSDDLPRFFIPWSIHCDDAPSRSGIFTNDNIGIVIKDSYKKWLEGLLK